MPEKTQTLVTQRIYIYQYFLSNYLSSVQIELKPIIYADFRADSLRDRWVDRYHAQRGVGQMRHQHICLRFNGPLCARKRNLNCISL
jgi:hypothetical protein